MVEDASPSVPYRVYTRAYDVEIEARELPQRLLEINPDRFEWRDNRGIGWNEAQRRVAAHLVDQAATDAAIFDILGDEAGDFAVTLLIDQSGSMKGAPIATVAAVAWSVVAALAAAGAETEVLGFSTVGWHGGRARQDWLRSGRPKRPGRLCALLHAVYKSAEEGAWSEQSARAMLHPDLLRENIDGEALDWAAKRLAGSSRPNKILIVLSDGAPVDDATLTENGPSYLERDVRRAISDIESDGSCTLGSLGIGFEVDRYYKQSRKGDLDQLLPDFLELFAQLVASRGKASDFEA